MIGALWVAAYAVIALAPAAIAVWVDPFTAPRPAATEISAALGLLALPLALLQFALVSRLRASSRPFGTDALVQFHQYMGFCCLALALAHPLLLVTTGLPWAAWNPLAGPAATRTGALALLALAALAATTVWRRAARLTYERWQQLHVALALAAGAALLAHAWTAGGYARAGVLRAVLAAYAAGAGATLVAHRVLRPLRLRRLPWEVVEARDEGGSTRTLRLRPHGHPGFAFDPGQFAWLITGRSPWTFEQHPLSISSSAVRGADGAIEFSVKALGDWSGGVVPALRPGARVWVDGPFGAFTIARRAHPGFVFVAGGIGIAPFRAMLLTMRDRGDRRPVVLFYAAHDATRAIFHGELDALARDLDLTLVRVYEAPPEGWTGERGRLTADLLRRHLPAAYRDFACLLCGPPAMMRHAGALLASLGIPARAIDTERFQVA